MASKEFFFCHLIFLCFCFSTNQHLQAKASTGNETDLISLIGIKDQIQGLTSWNQSFHFCQWQGITCGKRHQRVIALNLSSQGLVGTLSPHIGNLGFLKSIYFQRNKFHGEIPPEIGQLSRLQYLKMWQNNFTGEVSVNLTKCTNLVMIDFEENNLSGHIPEELGSLSKLTYLYLTTNSLTGGIPVSFGNLSSLQYLSLADNSLEGSVPHTLGKLSSLKLFSIDLNQFSGEFPQSLFNISSITNFSIVSNHLTGSLPPDMGITFPNLLFFAMAGNKFSGPFPVSVANASKIILLDIQSNNFTGQIPTNLGVLQNLRWLGLSHNYFGRGEAGDLNFILSLSNSSKLRTLSLTSNNFGGVLPTSLSNFSSQIQTFYLGGNQIEGIIPEGLGNLVSLIGLGLEGNRFHGNIPLSIGNIQKLQLLSLSGNRLTGPIPSSLGLLTRLSHLDLSQNRLEGNLPSSLGRLQNLQYLDISCNNLSGRLPKQIFTISALSSLLDFSKNFFSGSLPVDVGTLQSLGIMDISRNKLTGEIPIALGNCLGMEELYLENNFLQGTLPQSLTNLKGIRYIDLSRNNLSGQIPKNLQDMRLEGLNLSFNNLDGEVPTIGIFGNASAVSVAGNFRLCGGISELQLPTCKLHNFGKNGKSASFKVAIAITVASCFLLASFLLILYMKRNTESKTSSSTSMTNSYPKVSYRDLFRATGGFSPTKLVGSGSFGRVYEGILNHEEMIVAVKVFSLQQKGALKTFMAECESLCNIRHRNLVKIITCCSSTDFEGNDFKALVFEFMPNGSLEKWLHWGTGDQSRSLNLLQRLNIAIDVATALHYLHHQCHISIVHRDIKPSNVLLDNDMVAHVGDFGLAKLLQGSVDTLWQNQSTSMGVKGSTGYVAPEYGMGGSASTQGDTYSFGILLLELFTGRRPSNEMFVDGMNIHNFARMALPDRVMEIADPVLISTDEQEEAMKKCIASILNIGVICSAQLPGERMNMEEVANELHSIRDEFLSFQQSI